MEEVHAKSPGQEELGSDGRGDHGQIELQHVVHGANHPLAPRIYQTAESCGLARKQPFFQPSLASVAVS